jgi:hypothetical protein
MNVPNIGQGPERVFTLSRAIAGSDTIAPRADADAAAPGHSAATSPAISFTRLACFDVNGDGSIDTRSAAAGGDATLLVPTHTVDLPTYSRPAHPIGAENTSRDKSAEPTPAVATPNAAQANRAADAYERYGDTTPLPPSPPTPAPLPISATPIR